MTGVDGSDGASVLLSACVRPSGRPKACSGFREASHNADSDTSPEVFRELLASARRLATLVTLPRTQYRLRVMPNPPCRRAR